MMQLTTIANGLRVASRSMPGLETIAVGLFAEVGSRHEPAALNGIAHLFEHMVFKGAGGRSAREISETIEDVGGDLNACTERDGTCFTASAMAEHLPLAVELLADLVQRPNLASDELRREKEVVLQELTEARETPADIIFDELWSAAYSGQPLGRSILGDERSVRGIGVEDLRDWKSRFRPGGLCLVAAGNVRHDELVTLAERQFSAIPEGTSPPFEAARFTGGTRAVRKRGQQVHLAIAYESPAATDADYYAARMFSDIVGGGTSSRLFQEVREERGLAYSVSSALHPYTDTGIFSIYAATAAAEAGSTASLIADLLGQAALDATQRELERVRTQARAALLMSLETPWGQASYVARQLFVHGRLVEPGEVVEALFAVTLDDVRGAGAKMLSGASARATIGVPAVRAA